MRTVQIIVAVAMLGIGHEAFSQAAKEVNVANTPSVKEAVYPYVVQLFSNDYTVNPNCMNQTGFLICEIFVPSGKLLIVDKVTAVVSSFLSAPPNYIEFSFPQENPGEYSGGFVVMRPVVNGDVMEAYGPVYIRNNDFNSRNGSFSDGAFGIAPFVIDQGRQNVRHVVLTGRLVDDASP